MSAIRRFIYSKPVTGLLKGILSVFYKKQYLEGKFFEDKRMGYWWAISGIFRRIRNRRQGVDWPIGKNVSILNGNNICFDNSSLNVFQQSGCYYQAFEKIYIGKNVWIAPNVGIITANHDIRDPEKHSSGKEIRIGDGCWVGMNSVILPGVILGDGTIVGAGSIVTKSFSEGHCVIAGNPAKKIKDIF